MSKNRRIIESMLNSRSAVVELLVAACLLALGVNLAANGVSSLYDESPKLLVLMGSSVVLLSVALVCRRLLTFFTTNHEYSGCLLYDKEINELVPIPQYKVAEETDRYLKALFSENPAIKGRWDNDPITNCFSRPDESGRIAHRTTEAGKLVSEAVEYFILEELSTHLTDYFNSDSIDKSKLVTLTRDEVSGAVLQNRFLDTFCKPMNDRAVFSRNGDIPRSDAMVVSSFTGSGGYYSRFDLTLPKGSTIKRLSPSSLEINSPRFRLVIEVSFLGMNTVLPSDFEEMYLGRKSCRESSAYQLDCRLNFTFKSSAFLSNNGWAYYKWVDSFLEVLEQRLDKKSFLESIHWDSSYTTMKMIKNFRNAQSLEK